MRERLISMLCGVECAGSDRREGGCGYRDSAKCNRIEKLDYCMIACIADHLLANGVIVPPVKLGSRHKVYIPVKGTTVVYETKVYGIGVDEDGDMVINPKEYSEEVIAINGCNIGKTVFLTREDAEKALKGGEG